LSSLELEDVREKCKSPIKIKFIIPAPPHKRYFYHSLRVAD